MTLFYDPKTRKSKPWVIIAFICVPFIVILLFWILGQNRAQNLDKAVGIEEKDIFK